MLNTLLSFINSLFVTEPASWMSSWKAKRCDTCHDLLPAPDGSLQRFPDSQQMIGDYCTTIKMTYGHGDYTTYEYGCKVTLLSPYYYNHTNLITT